MVSTLYVGGTAGALTIFCRSPLTPKIWKSLHLTVINRIEGIRFQKGSKNYRKVRTPEKNIIRASESYSSDVKQEHVKCGCNILGLKSKPSRGFEPWWPTTVSHHDGVLTATTLAAAVSAHRTVSNIQMGRMAYGHADQGVLRWA